MPALHLLHWKLWIFAQVLFYNIISPVARGRQGLSFLLCPKIGPTRTIKHFIVIYVDVVHPWVILVNQMTSLLNEQKHSLHFYVLHYHYKTIYCLNKKWNKNDYIYGFVSKSHWLIFFLLLCRMNVLREKNVMRQEYNITKIRITGFIDF